MENTGDVSSVLFFIEVEMLKTEIKESSISVLGDKPRGILDETTK